MKPVTDKKLKNRNKQNNPQDKQENACNFILTLYRRSADRFI
jgi:hypothetical protein